MGLLRKIIEWCYANDSGNKKKNVSKDKNKLRKAQEECRENIQKINDKLFYLTEGKREIERVMTNLIKEYEKASANTKSGYKIQIMALKKDLDAKNELERILETRLQQQVLLLNKLEVNEEISKLESQVDVTEELLVDNMAKLEELEQNQRTFDELEQLEYKGRNKQQDEKTENQNEADDDFQKFIKEFADNNKAEDEEIASARKSTAIQERN